MSNPVASPLPPKRQTKRVKRGNIQDYFNNSPTKQSFLNVLQPTPTPTNTESNNLNKATQDESALDFDIFDLLKTKNDSNSNLKEVCNEKPDDQFTKLKEKLYTYSSCLQTLLCKKMTLISKSPLVKLRNSLKTLKAVRTYSYQSANTVDKDFVSSLQVLGSVFDFFTEQKQASMIVRMENLEFYFSNDKDLYQELQNIDEHISKSRNTKAFNNSSESKYFCLVSWKQRIENRTDQKHDEIDIQQQVHRSDRNIESKLDHVNNSKLLNKIKKTFDKFCIVNLTREDLFSDDYSLFEFTRNDFGMSDKGILFEDRQLLLVFQCLLSFYETSRNASFSIFSDFFFGGCRSESLVIKKCKHVFVSDSAFDNFQMFQERKADRGSVLEKVQITPRQWTKVETCDMSSSPQQMFQTRKKEDYFVEIEGRIFGRVLTQVLSFGLDDASEIFLKLE